MTAPVAFAPEAIPDYAHLSFQLLSRDPKYNGHTGCDAVLEISLFNSSEKVAVFAVEYKRGWQERDFQAAFWHLKELNLPPKVYPLLVLPFLSQDRINFLEKNRFSGLDYCGNLILIVPEQNWYIRATGNANIFQPQKTEIKNPYRGKSALVARSLLLCPHFRKLEDLHRSITQMGGEISLSLVSRTVQKLDEDAITRPNKGHKIWLVQPAKLLQGLLQYTSSSKPRLLWQGRVSLTGNPLLRHLFALSGENKQRLAVTGLGSAQRHVNLAMEKTVRVYVELERSFEPLLADLSPRETTRFPDLEIYAAPDETVYFNTDNEPVGGTIVRWASLLQTYLEMQSGDARLQDSAAPLKERILDALREGVHV